MEKFGFIIHPLDMIDIIRFEPKVAGKRQALVEKVLEWTPPYVYSDVVGIRSLTGAEAEGWFINCPLFPRQFLEMDRAYVYDKIIKTGKIAEEKGAKILGLGAFSSVVGDGGFTVAKNMNIPVTSGNSFTIATSIEGALKAAERMEIDLEKATAVVIGATGSIGSVCTKIISRHVGRTLLGARNETRLKKMTDQMRNQSDKVFDYSVNIPHIVQQGDIIITATSSIDGLVRAEDLKIGAVVCDVSLPHDVCRDVAHKRDDCLIIEGGLVEVPGPVNFNCDFGYPPGLALACMSETIILTLEKRFENYSLGRSISIEKVEEIAVLAKKHGFKLAGFRSFDRMLTDEEIDKIKQNAARRRKK